MFYLQNTHQQIRTMQSQPHVSNIKWTSEFKTSCWTPATPIAGSYQAIVYTCTFALFKA